MNSNKFCLGHNNRDFSPRNADADREKDNIYWEGNYQSVEEFYDKNFQKSYEEYIERTRKRHPERVRDLPKTFYEKVRNENAEDDKALEELKAAGASVSEKKKHTCRSRLCTDTVIQFGGKDDWAEMSEEQKKICIDILKDYMNNFEKRNPEIKIIHASIHMDEQTPHLHVISVPCTHANRGQNITNSMNQALKNMGIVQIKEVDETTKKTTKFITPQMQFERKEREYLCGLFKEKCAELDMNLSYKKGRIGHHKEPSEFRQEQNQKTEKKIKDFEKTYAEKKQKLQRMNDAYENNSNILKKQKIEYDAKKEELDAIKYHISSTAIYKRCQELETELERVNNELSRVTDERDYFMHALNVVLEYAKKYFKKFLKELNLYRVYDDRGNEYGVGNCVMDDLKDAETSYYQDTADAVLDDDYTELPFSYDEIGIPIIGLSTEPEDIEYMKNELNDYPEKVKNRYNDYEER